MNEYSSDWADFQNYGWTPTKAELAAEREADRRYERRHPSPKFASRDPWLDYVEAPF